MAEIMYSIEETARISDVLDKLFILQDKSINEKKTKYFIQEFEQRATPPKILIQAIESLYYSDLKSIKIATIIESVQNFVTERKENIIQGFCILPNELNLGYKYIQKESSGKDTVICEIKTIIENEVMPMDVFFNKKHVILKDKLSIGEQTKTLCTSDDEIGNILLYDIRFQTVEGQKWLKEKQYQLNEKHGMGYMPQTSLHA